jgi:IclR family acetate operon transcriptional repressor
MPAPTITYLLWLGIIAPPFTAAETSRYYCPEGNSISISTRDHIVARTGQPATRQVAAVQRAIAILTELADAGTELGTNEIARRTGINVSTISRILATLVSGGLVEHVTTTGRYRLGVGVIRLASAAGRRLDVRSVARPHLEELAGRIQETVTLSVPGGHEAVTLDYVQSPLSVRSVAEVGRTSVAHATAVGKVFLAHGGTVPDGELKALTGRTIVDHDVLRAEVARVRERGWAQALGEREEDLNAVAVPVLDRAGKLVAILGAQGPAARFGPRVMRSAVELLVDRAERVSSGL